jgi:hypothetical protein
MMALRAAEPSAKRNLIYLGVMLRHPNLSRPLGAFASWRLVRQCQPHSRSAKKVTMPLRPSVTLPNSVTCCIAEK